MGNRTTHHFSIGRGETVGMVKGQGRKAIFLGMVVNRRVEMLWEPSRGGGNMAACAQKQWHLKRVSAVGISSIISIGSASKGRMNVT
jgi:hypothetical protein